jgi:ribosomal protein S12 methylthiotransferase
VQHIATPVLRAMRRAGSGDQVRKLLERLPQRGARTSRCARRCWSVSPAKPTQDVEELCQFIREYRLGRLGAFTYSPEEGTSGFDLPGRVSAKEAKARQKAVFAARDEALKAEQEARVGQVLEVLVDESSPQRGMPNVARGDFDAPEVDLVTLVRGKRLAVGSRVKVEIEGLDAEHNLVAKQVKH